MITTDATGRCDALGLPAETRPVEIHTRPSSDWDTTTNPGNGPESHPAEPTLATHQESGARGPAVDVGGKSGARGVGRPRLLDAYCGAGGATRGYQRAGFHVTGVDIAPQPRYCGDEFRQADAIEFIREHAHEFAAIHASPPCQASCALTKGTNKGRKHPQLIHETRKALNATRRPWVMENVQGSDLARWLTLCGEYFDLDVIRHRYFEISGFFVFQPEHIPHRGRVAGWRHGERYDGPYFAVYGDGGGKGTVAQWQAAMGIDWTDDSKELTEAIPPAYTEYVGSYLMAEIRSRAA